MAKVVRSLPRTHTLVEDFGAPVVTVKATATGDWSRLVALLTATTPTGRTIVVSAGGVPTLPGTRRYAIRLISQVTAIPTGSTACIPYRYSRGLLRLYLELPAAGSPRLTIRGASLRLPVLAKPVSS